jgi:hypothetical protein
VIDPPEHWTWRDGPVGPGPAVVVDLDGVLSDAASRQHYLESPRQDWRSFFDACGDDDVIEEIRVLLELLADDLRVVLLTARPARVHHLTEAWLRRYRIRWDLLVMRPYGDYDVSRAFKEASAARGSPASTGTPATTTDGNGRGRGGVAPSEAAPSGTKR